MATPKKLKKCPAGRAFERNGVNTLRAPAACSEKDVLQWHGAGPASLPRLREALRAAGLSFKK